MNLASVSSLLVEVENRLLRQVVEAEGTSDLYRVVVNAEDGESVLFDGLSYEDARKKASAWLGRPIGGEDDGGKDRGVSDYGQVVTIERGGLSKDAQKLMDFISYSWSTDPEELAWETANDGVWDGEPWSEKKIDGVLDALIKAGRIKWKESTDTWKKRKLERAAHPKLHKWYDAFAEKMKELDDWFEVRSAPFDKKSNGIPMVMDTVTQKEVAIREKAVEYANKKVRGMKVTMSDELHGHPLNTPKHQWMIVTEE